MPNRCPWHTWVFALVIGSTMSAVTVSGLLFILDPFTEFNQRRYGIVVTDTELHFTKALPESMARDIHERFLERARVRNAIARRPPGLLPVLEDVSLRTLDPVFLLLTAVFSVIARFFLAARSSRERVVAQDPMPRS